MFQRLFSILLIVATMFGSTVCCCAMNSNGGKLPKASCCCQVEDKNEQCPEKSDSPENNKCPCRGHFAAGIRPNDLKLCQTSLTAKSMSPLMDRCLRSDLDERDHHFGPLQLSNAAPPLFGIGLLITQCVSRR